MTSAPQYTLDELNSLTRRLNLDDNRIRNWFKIFDTPKVFNLTEQDSIRLELVKFSTDGPTLEHTAVILISSGNTGRVQDAANKHLNRIRMITVKRAGRKGKNESPEPTPREDVEYCEVRDTLLTIVRVLSNRTDLPFTEIDVEKTIASLWIDPFDEGAYKAIEFYYELLSRTRVPKSVVEANNNTYAKCSGISLYEAALIFSNEDEDSAKERVKKWTDQRSVERPESIGFHERHKQRPIFEPAATAAFIKKIEGYLTMDESVFIQRLIAISKPPRENN